MGEGVAAARVGRGSSLCRDKGFQRVKVYSSGLVWEASVQSQWINQHSYHRKEFRRKASGNIR